MPPTTSVTDSLVGLVLDGRYQIVDRLARGGMATVYRATDQRLTRTVAVKIMHVGLGDDAEFARKFDREARAAARLSHPNVVSVFDQGLAHLDGHGPRPYIVMEYVDGITLRDLINAEAPLPPQRALELMEPVLGALACAHDGGLVHRDVKPENVLISERGTVKVADFGLAKAVTSQTSTATQGLLIGTVSYLPPELVLSGKADARSDVYSAGVVLFELLTGLKPHTGETPIQVAYAHVHRDVPPPSSFPTAGGVPPYLDALVNRLTSRNADRRPPGARATLVQLRRVLSAVRSGVADDAELTEDLSGVRTAHEEPTRTVGHPGNHPAAPPRITRTTAPRTPSSPPTILDAPPPPARREAEAWPGAVPHPGGPSGSRPYRPSPQVLAEHREHARRRRVRGVLALLLVLLLTVGAAAGGWYLTEGRYTLAPDLRSLTEAQAGERAAGVGLGVDLRTAHSETVPAGTVIATEPGAGVKVPDGGSLAVVVSKGPERHPTPRLVGLTRVAAGTALTGADLAVGRVRATYDERVAAGVVTAAAVRPGVPLRRGTAVDLVVSRGPRPIPVPDLEGTGVADARKRLEKAGFDVRVTRAHSDRVPSGRVVSQRPDSGTGKRGDRVTLTESIGPVLVTVPNVRRMGIKAAEEVLKEAGFRVRTRPVAVNYLGLGYVASSTPGSATKAPRGSTVTLYLV